MNARADEPTDEELSVRQRIENWSNWVQLGKRNGLECMTGIVCDRMRSAALGNVWSGHGNGPRWSEIDAIAMERAWRTLPPEYRDVLLWHHIHRAPVGFICRRIRIAPRPASVYALLLADAERRLVAAATSGPRRAL
jgi:hypothetical protein